MKQIFYGPAGYGKSHLILHGLIQKGNLVIITTNGIQLELDTVGLQDVDIKTIPVSVEKGSEKSSSHISIEVKGVYEKSRDNIIGFDLLTIPTEYEGMAMDEILDWLEKTGISNSHNHTIVFINIPKEIKIPSFIDRIEKWNSDVVIDQMINERLPMCIDHYLHTIRMSGKWFEIPVFVPMCRMNSNTLLKFDKLGGIEQKKRMDERLAKTTNYPI